MPKILFDVKISYGAFGIFVGSGNFFQHYRFLELILGYVMLDTRKVNGHETT